MAEESLAVETKTGGIAPAPTYENLALDLTHAGAMCETAAREAGELAALIAVLKTSPVRSGELLELAHRLAEEISLELQQNSKDFEEVSASARAGLPRKRWESCSCPDCEATPEDLANEARVKA